jgi:hypothetical protein
MVKDPLAEAAIDAAMAGDPVMYVVPNITVSVPLNRKALVDRLVKRVRRKVDPDAKRIVSQHDGYSKLLMEIDNLRHNVRRERGGGQVTEEIMIRIAALSLQYAIDQCQWDE